jgi:hypothetical protein
VALHVALGHEVGLCDLTLGEMASNGTVEDRRREAADAAKVLGVAWRQNLEWPDGGITSAPEFVRSAVDLLPRASPRTIAIPHTGRIAIPIMSPPAKSVDAGGIQERPAPVRDARRAVAARVGLLLLHQRRRHAVVRCAMSRRTIRKSATRSRASARSSHPR